MLWLITQEPLQGNLNEFFVFVNVLTFVLSNVSIQFADFFCKTCEHKFMAAILVFRAVFLNFHLMILFSVRNKCNQFSGGPTWGHLSPPNIFLHPVLPHPDNDKCVKIRP